MSTYSDVFEIARWGREITPGTAVNTVILPPGMVVEMGPSGDDAEAHVASGHLFPYGVSQTVKGSAGSYDLLLSYDEAHLIYDSYYKTVTATGAGAAKTRLYEVAINAASPYTTYTIEKGQTGKVMRYINAIANSWALSIDKVITPHLTGGLLAKRSVITTGFAGSPTTLPANPVQAIDWDVYTGTGFGGTWTQHISSFALDITAPDRYGTETVINSASTSWDIVGYLGAGAHTVSIFMPADASGSDFAGHFTRAKLDAGTGIYLRAKAEGAELETGINQKFQIDMHVKLLNDPQHEVRGTISGLRWPAQIMADSSGDALEITIVSATA